MLGREAGCSNRCRVAFDAATWLSFSGLPAVGADPEERNAAGLPMPARAVSTSASPRHVGTYRLVTTWYGLMLSDAHRRLQVFVVNPAKKLALSILYPATTGRCALLSRKIPLRAFFYRSRRDVYRVAGGCRNFDEILRVVDSLQLTANFKVATPANWTHGDNVMITPAVSNDEAVGSLSPRPACPDPSYHSDLR